MLYDIDFKRFLPTREYNVMTHLYRPALQNTNLYVRGVGYFRSSVYRLMTEDLLQFCENGGKVILLTSTEWGRKDYDSLMKSFDEGETFGKEYYENEISSLLEDSDHKISDPTRMLVALVHLGYLDQHTDVLSDGKGLDRKVIDFVEEAASTIDLGNEQLSASQLLERFLFPPAQQHSPLSKLSGGERRRFSLCRMLIQAPNVLLLEEPTNELDVQTLSVLEDLLEDFRGCVVVVSHDRYFLDRTVDRLFCFENGRLQRFEGNYSAFLDHRRDLEKAQSEALAAHENAQRSSKATSKQGSIPDNKPKRRSFKESKELERLDSDLPALELRKQELEQAMASGGGDLSSLSLELAALLDSIHTSEERWLELSELEP